MWKGALSRMISVIVPVYRVEPYIERCIRGILAQTYSDWELLLVNDASPDGSLEIARRYAALDPRIRILDRQINRGVAVTRNEGMAAAKGDWLAFCDGDDWYEPDFLEKMLRAAEDAGADMAVCDSRIAAEGRKAFAAGDNSGISAESSPAERLAFGSLSCCKRLVRKSLADACGCGFAEGCRNYEELPAVGSWLVKAERIVVLRDALYNYYQRRDGNSASNTVDPDRIEADFCRGLSLLKESIGPGYENALDMLTAYALFYGVILSLAKAKAGRRTLKDRIRLYKQRFPTATDSPWVARMPKTKRVFLYFVKKERILPLRFMALVHGLLIG